MDTEKSAGLAAPAGADGMDWYGRLLELVAAAPWQPKSKEDCRINVRWFLSFCRQRQLEVAASSAEAFLAWLRGERGAPDWQVERVERSVRWFLDRTGLKPATPKNGSRNAHASEPVAQN